MSSSQNYFSYIESKKIDPSIDYNILVSTEDGTKFANLKVLFIDKPVQVKKVKNGYLYCGFDGRHRYYVAKKYNMDLLVDVVNDRPSLPERNIRVFRKFFK